uniref:Uncharacterized protein n=1 Tax=Syphacia muris TaxID=451379 RepID=A0A0N5AZV2_9BILA
MLVEKTKKKGNVSAAAAGAGARARARARARAGAGAVLMNSMQCRCATSLSSTHIRRLIKTFASQIQYIIGFFIFFDSSTNYYLQITK